MALSGSDHPKISELCDYVRVDVAPHWYDLGIHLLNAEQAKKLNVIQSDHPEDSEKCCTALFNYWLQVDTTASWDKLIIALNQIGQDVLANRIKTMRLKGISSVSEDDFVNVSDLFKEPITITKAYTILIRQLANILNHCDLSTLKVALIHQAHTPDGVELEKSLEKNIMAAKSVSDLLVALGRSHSCNWLDTRLIEVLAYGSESSTAVEIIKAYQQFLFSKKLSDVLSRKREHMELKRDYVTAIRLKTKMDPTKITVGDFINYRWTIEDVILDLGKGVLNIEHVNEGCLEVNYVMPVYYSFNAYKMVLHNRHKFFTIDLIHVEIGEHPLIFDPWLSDLEKHSVNQILHTRHKVSSEICHILLDNIPMDDIIQLFTAHKILIDDDVEVVSFVPSEHLRKKYLLKYLWNLKLAVWPVICDILLNTKSMKHVGSQLIEVLKDILPHMEYHKQTSASSNHLKIVNTLHGTRTIKFGFVDDSILFNKPQAYHSRKLSLHISPFKHVKCIEPSEIEKEFYYVSGHIVELLNCYHHKLLIKWYENLMASEIHQIKLLPPCGVCKLKKLGTSSAILKMMSIFWSWSNHSILTSLVEFSEIAAALLEEFDSRLYLNSSITKYPISSSLAPSMIPHNNNSFTVLTLKCNRKLQVTLQLVYDMQSMIIEKCEITQHALQLLAVQSSPLVLQWMISKYIVDLINVNIRKHQKYFATKGITEILIHPHDCIDGDTDTEVRLLPLVEVQDSKADWADTAINQFLAAEISEFPKDILTNYVNDVTVDDVEKRAKCNKLLRKAVQDGDIDLVELILTNAANQVDVNNPVNENDVTTVEKNPKLSVNPAYIGWTPLHFAANIMTNVLYLSNSLTQYQDVRTDARLAGHLQLQVRALDIIMLLWRANANPLIPANKNVLPADVACNHNVIALLLRILMDLKDNSQIADILDDLDNDYKTLMEWACKCAHVEIATHILGRLNDPNAELLQVTKGSIILRILGRSEKLEHFEILDALFKKYKDSMQEHIFDRNHACASPKTHGSTPLSIACQFDEDTKLYNNKRFIEWSLRCFSNSLTEINLYNTGLTGKLSLMLFQFINLKVLNVSKNSLTGLIETETHPAFACNKLEEAIFYDNKFTVVPKSLFLLPKLKNLNFADNKITNLNLDGIELCQVPISNLNLSCNEIRVIPDQIFYLPNLMHLNLDNNEIAEMPVQMWFSPCLVHLSINNNSLVELPVLTEEFHAELSISSLGTNDTGYCSDSFRETMMRPYETIEFEESNIDMVQGSGSYGLRLDKLQLDGNKLQQIPADLACLAPYLSELSVANNELAITPCFKSLPVLLKKLNLSSNKLTTFLTPFFVSLYPSENCLRKKIHGLFDTCTHCAHNTLVKLEKLDMSYNLIDDDVYTKYNGIVYFEKLIDLNLSNNKFKTFPDFILHQPLLSILDVSKNFDIKNIPRSLAKLPLISFEYLGIADPVVKTLECFPSDVSSKLRCLRMLTQKMVKINSMKMMIVGMHQKGKTTLLQHLRSKGDFESQNSHQPPKESVTKTVGIKLGLWKYSKNRGNPTNKHPIIEFYTWDFAGDEEYYWTYQLFLHSRAIYLVVWNVLDKEDGIYSLSSWLQGIYARAPKSAVIIVGTHLDLIEASQRKQFAKRYHELIEQSFTNHQDQPFRLPLIKGICFVGLVPGTHGLFTHDMYVDELRDYIYDTALNMESCMDEFAIAMNAPHNVKIVDELVPENFKKFYQETIRRRKEIFIEGNVFPILEYRHFEYLAEVTEIPKDEVTTILLYLQSQGLIVHFEFRELSNCYFIDPEWLNQVFSSLLSRDNVKECITSEFISNGIILREHLERHLIMVHHIPPKHVKNVVRLLERFQVIVSIGLNSLLVPALLTDDAATITIIKGSFPRPATITPLTIQTSLLAIQTSQPGYLTTIPALQMLSTGVVMRRLFVLDGILYGFWPKLIAHFYTERTFSDIVNKAIKRALQLDVDPGDNFTPKWHYSKHNIELVINHTTILKIGSVGRDYMDMTQTSYCSEINLANFHFYDVTGEFKISDFKLCSGVLIEVNDCVFASCNPERVIHFTKDNCQHSAELLAFAVEMFDCLLSEVFHRFRLHDDSNWLKELIPCPFCLGDKRVGETEYAGSDGQDDEVVDPSSKYDDLLQEPYYFTINYCLIEIKHNQKLQCPKHGVLAIEYLAPDLIFQDISHKIYTPASFSKHYELLEREESGSFGKVFKDYQSNVAVKIIKAYPLSENKEYLSYTYKCVRQEINKLLYLKPHPQIAQVLGVLCNPYGLVLELAPVGDLQSSVIDNYRYTNNLLCSTAILLTLKQISSALAYLHEHRIIHRDVKPTNILVFSYPNENHISVSNPQNWNCENCVGKDGSGVLVKLSDFGISARVTIFEYYSNAGTAGYRAPEVAGLPATGYNEKVDVYSLAMTLYAMLTLRHIPLKGVPHFEQLIMAGRRPKFTTTDPMYPFILYECIRCCWHQEQSMRPSAKTILERLSKFPSSLLNKYTLEAPNSLCNVTMIFGNQMQRLWAVMENRCRSHHNSDITKNVELISMHQHDVTQLQINKIDQLPPIENDATICVTQLGKWVIVGYEDKMAVYDAISEIEITPYKVIHCPKCSCSLNCLEVYPNNPTSLFAGQVFGKVHLLFIEDVEDSDNWVKYCYDLNGEELITMRACWYDTHVELWCSTVSEYIEILQFPMNAVDCNNAEVQANIVRLPLPTAGRVVSIECCMVDDELLIFTSNENSTVVTCWNGLTKEFFRNIHLSETLTCIRVIEPNLYIGTQSGDMVTVTLEDIMDTQLGFDHWHWVHPYTDIQRYCHRGPVLALVGAYGTLGCQGNLTRLFSSQVDVNQQFRQEMACSLAISIGYGYQSPWNREENDDDDVGQSIDQQDNHLCFLVHLVC